MQPNTQHQLIGTWFVLITLVCFGLSFWPFAGFLPPLPATMTPDEVAAYFRQHTSGIRLGMIFMLEAGAFYCVLTAIIATQLKRIENVSSILTYTQIISGAVGSVIILVGGMLMTAAVFRPERPLELTYLMFDIAWLFIVMPSTSYTLQFFSIGLAILSDKKPVPVFPRWVGYVNLWVGLMVAPGLLVSYFKAGPFAWNGLIAFWAGVIAFGIWFFVMFFMLRKAIKQASPATAG